MARPSVRIILPDEERERDDEHFEELMVEGLTLDEDFQEINEEEDNVTNSILEHETLQQDFFDQTQKEEVYGEIKGMEDITDEQEEVLEEVDESVKESQENLDLAKPVRDSKTATVYTEDEKNEEIVDRYSQSTFDEDLKKQVVLKESLEEQEESDSGTTIYRPTLRGRPSIFYDISSRIRASVEDDMEKLFSLNQQDNVIMFDDLQEAAEAESKATIIEEEEERFDRLPYYEQYDKLVNESFVNRCKNNILQKLTIMYLKRRKTENITKDLEPPMDQTLKYGQKLDAYQELIDISVEQRASVAKEVELAKQKRNTKIEELKHEFKAMQNKESNVGHGLIYAKTGSQISDKLVDRLLRRQAILIDQVSSMRLKCIKLKGLVQEKLEQISKLDTLENNLLLADFEQLKVENRSHADKMEERDEELTRLRAKCQSTIQILAHVREKSYALDSDLYQQQEGFGDVDDRTRDLRGNLAYLKHTRDEYRQMTRKLKDNSGLLLKPTLLIDMEESQNELARLEEEIAKCKNDVETKQNKVRKLRRVIEVLKEKKKAGELKKLSEATEKTTKTPKKFKLTTVYKKRPTMYMPAFKEDAFDGILKIQPNPKVYNRKK